MEIRSLPKPFPYSVPEVLQNQISALTYRQWLNVKASSLRKRDLRTHKPFANATPRNVYMQKLNSAVIATGLFDPYTGDALRWDLIGTWDPATAKGNAGYKREYDRLPTADHVNPDANGLEFEICSWMSNTAKTFLAPRQFVALCAQITAYRSKQTVRKTGTTPVYRLPVFLSGICAPAVYRKWLDTRAKQEYKRDVALKRPCAAAGSKSLYKQAIHDAVVAGKAIDPFTGCALRWDLIETWGNAAPKDRANREKEFSLLPTVDHTDPSSPVIGFEICSWLVNDSKGNLSAKEYVDYCGRVVAHAKAQ